MVKISQARILVLRRLKSVFSVGDIRGLLASLRRHRPTGQSFDYVAEGATGGMETPRNGSYTYSISTDAPEAPADACPNGAWTAEVVDVEYGPATVSLYEGGALVDSVTLPVD